MFAHPGNAELLAHALIAINDKKSVGIFILCGDFKNIDCRA